MFRAGNQCLLDQKSVASQFEAEVFLNDAQKLLPELAAENGWIRSGLRIRETFKNMISSYRLIGVTPLTEGKPRAEALLVKTQVGINAVAAADACGHYFNDNIVRIRYFWTFDIDQTDCLRFRNFNCFHVSTFFLY